MVKIHFYSGLKEIGGTFVQVETEQAVCMFDFGFAVVDRLDEKVRKRRESYVADYVRLGLLPKVDDIYETNTANDLGIRPYEKRKKSVFMILSHMHIDHMGGLGMIDQELPVYMSSDSLKLYDHLSMQGELEYRKHKNCIGVEPEKIITIGDLTVEMIPIDHDIIGACGYRITTPQGTVVYTGDYRFHGFHPEVSQAFAQKVKGADVLITEGVTVSFDDVDLLSLDAPEEGIRTEMGLQEEMHQLFCKETGLVIINPYNRNVERVHHLIDTAFKAGRKLVLDQVEAAYVAAFYPEDELYVYEETIRNEALLNPLWRLVARKELLDSPQNYVLQLDYQDSFELLNLKSVVTNYVHMDGAPLGDYDPSYQKLLHLLEYIKIPYNYRSLGGHARPFYLKQMIDTIEPGCLIPLHSFRPEQVVSEKAGCRYLPEYGESYCLKEHKLTKEEREKYENINSK